MDILDFFDKDKALVRVQLPSPQVGVELQVDSDEIHVSSYEVRNHDNDFDYAKQYRDEEEASCLDQAIANPVSDILRPDSPTSCNTALRDYEIDTEVTGNVYAKYKFDNRQKNTPNLSINAFQGQITNLISANSVIVIQGPTGCGKTTQVPQYILDYCQAQNKYCKIAVTQPRRIAAISVAKRVSEERGWPLGTIVGYQVALDSNVTEDTVLTYMTTGVLLQKLVLSKNLNQYTHIIIDEVHEREAEMDFLLLIVRKFVRTVSRHVKVILMSATFDVVHFSNYFLVPKGSQLVTAPVIDVTKTQPYTVNIYYLNQFEQLLPAKISPDFNPEEPTLYSDLHQVVLKLLRTFNNFDSDNKHGSVLIFLPGIYEIEDLYDLLRKENDGPVQWFIVPLHSSITIEEQRKAFENPPAGHRKIILSTNIAESSITVPDVVYVIDFCLTKLLISDSQSNYTSLKLCWASHTNCQQRSGRVGRVSSGRVYRLVTQDFYDNNMARDIIPEMLRSPLHRLVLMSKMLDLDIPPHGILALAIDRPPLHNIDQTILLLQEAGALLPTVNGVNETRNGDLTYMGRIMAQLPLEINISKLIILGYMFSTLKECIIMAAATSLQNIFSSPFNERLKAYQSKLSWADCSCSDLIAYLHVYVVWERNKYNNYFRANDTEKNWMRRNFLQPRVMKEWRILVTEIKNRLKRLGICEPIEGREGNLTEHEKAMMLKVVISGAFYPNYFVRSSEGGQVDESLAVRTLGGRDPYTTIYFSKKQENQPIEPYVKFMRDMLKECGQNLQISHDNSSKVYVQFKHDMIPSNTKGRNNALIPGKIAIEVYNSVKYRHSKLPATIPCLSAEEARYRVNHWKKQQAESKKYNEENIVLLKSVVPGYETLIIEIGISYVNNPGHFFAHNVENAEVMQMLEKVEKELNSTQLEDVTEEIVVGNIYAAPFHGKMYRVRVICMVPTGKTDVTIQVIFMDYGNVESIPKSHLKKILPRMSRIPPLVLECVLTNVQPSHDMNIHALWSKEATETFIQLTSERTLYGKVYSVVDNIVSLELYRKTPQYTMNNISLNRWLVEKGYAEPAIESFLSQDNHKTREFVQNSKSSTDVYYSEIEWYDKNNEMPAPDPRECRFTMTLKGPYSPLEMRVYSVIQCSLAKSVMVEWNSVNSVLLDTEPQDPHDRLLVAGSVSQTVDGSKLSLRHTTIMPNIHGFPVIMALLFCPKMELHADKEGTRLTSVLCGLGQDPGTKESLFPAHDLVLNLDFELISDLITRVNEIRYFMNNAVQAMSCYKTENQPLMAIETCQNEIRKIVRQLLKFPQKSIERIILPNSHIWGKLPPNAEIVSPVYMNKDHIWPMHSFVRLLDTDKMKMKKHLEELRDFANNTVAMTEITCKICDIVLYDIMAMRIHIVSQRHKEKEKEYQTAE